MNVVAIMKNCLHFHNKRKKKRREFNVWEENCTIEDILKRKAQAKLKLFWIFK